MIIRVIVVAQRQHAQTSPKRSANDAIIYVGDEILLLNRAKKIWERAENANPFGLYIRHVV